MLANRIYAYKGVEPNGTKVLKTRSKPGRYILLFQSVLVMGTRFTTIELDTNKGSLNTVIELSLHRYGLNKVKSCFSLT